MIEVFAAMRYTESRCKYAELLLSELGRGRRTGCQTSTAFDAGTENVTGMRTSRMAPAAVGVATDIPPHNLREVAKAAITLNSRKRRWIQLLDIVGGQITRPKRRSLPHVRKFVKFCENGRGSVRMRAVD